MGLLFLVVLGPIVVAGFGLAALALIGALTGWGPDFLKSDSSIDFLYGGDGFTATRYATFMAGAVIGGLASAAIRWGFTGEFEPPWS